MVNGDRSKIVYNGKKQNELDENDEKEEV